MATMNRTMQQVMDRDRGEMDEGENCPMPTSAAFKAAAKTEKPVKAKK